jgi:hypothetical protein
VRDFRFFSPSGNGERRSEITERKRDLAEQFAWTSDGSFAGTFVMEATLRLSRSGAGHTGTWKADSFDTFGALIPNQHFEGTARATKVGMDVQF